MITFKDIAKVNENLSTTNIKGKDYVEVNQRIKAFRYLYPQGFIKTILLSDENGVCKFKASVGYYAEDGKEIELANGTAYEKESSSFINKTSYIENCETSAIGRALGMCGFGIDTSVASYEEVQNAINNQESKPQIQEIDYKILVTLANKKGVMEDKLKAKYKVSDLHFLSKEQYDKCINGLKDMADV